MKLTLKQQRLGWVKLGISSSPLIGAFFYNPGYQIPGLTCPLKLLTGVPCPGCGMTRAFVAIAHGDLSAARDYNLLSPVVYLALAFTKCGLPIATFHFSLELWQNRPILLFYKKWITTKKLLWLSCIFAVGYNLTRWYQLFKIGELSNSFRH